MTGPIRPDALARTARGIRTRPAAHHGDGPGRLVPRAPLPTWRVRPRRPGAALHPG
ncbi:hypothetical protein LT493_10405 [Streptomyces tricolor]|nr:hypothetical protein [Streptomyces tricolor]